MKPHIVEESEYQIRYSDGSIGPGVKALEFMRRAVFEPPADVRRKLDLD